MTDIEAVGSIALRRDGTARCADGKRPRARRVGDPAGDTGGVRARRRDGGARDVDIDVAARAPAPADEAVSVLAHGGDGAARNVDGERRRSSIVKHIAIDARGAPVRRRDRGAVHIDGYRAASQLTGIDADFVGPRRRDGPVREVDDDVHVGEGGAPAIDPVVRPRSIAAYRRGPRLPRAGEREERRQGKAPSGARALMAAPPPARGGGGLTFCPPPPRAQTRYTDGASS